MPVVTSLLTTCNELLNQLSTQSDMILI